MACVSKGPQLKATQLLCKVGICLHVWQWIGRGLMNLYKNADEIKYQIKYVNPTLTYT